MHKFAKQIMECVKTKVEAMGIDNIEGQHLEELEKWTEIAKNIVCYDKDYNIVEAMKEAENEDNMRAIEMYEDYPDRRYYDNYRYKTSGRFAPKGRGTYRRNYDEPMWHMTPEMYRDMDREAYGRMYYTEPTHMHDSREGKSGMSRRTYMDTRDAHKANTQQDKEAKMHDLEAYMRELSDDLTELIADMIPEEKNLAKSKLSTLVSKM